MASALANRRSRQSQAQQSPEPDYAVPVGMRNEQFHAMGTTISLLLPERQSESGLELVRSLFAEWESALSRFLPESELSQLNRRAGESVVVSDLLFSVLKTALEAVRATNGLYDPTLRDQLVLLGYDRTFEALPSAQPAVTWLGRGGGGWRNIRMDEKSHRVTLPADAGLDFGGIAKGMAVDAALNRLREAGIESALVNAGGDLAVLGQPPEGADWPISIPGRGRSWIIPLHHGAMATSGIARRHWKQGNDLRHHLLDPRTGLPAQRGLWSVTVVAARCEQAEVAAKVAFILGRTEGKMFLSDHHLAGLLVSEDGTWETVHPWLARSVEE